MKRIVFLLCSAAGLLAADVKYDPQALIFSDLTAACRNASHKLFRTTKIAEESVLPEEITDMYVAEIWRNLADLTGKTALVPDLTTPEPKVKQIPVLETALGKFYWRLAVNGINETLAADPETVSRAHTYFAAAHAHPAMLRSLVLANLSQSDICESAYYWQRYHGYVNSHITRSACFQIAFIDIRPRIEDLITENAEMFAEMSPECLLEFKAHLLARFYSLTYQLEQDPALFRLRFSKFLSNNTGAASSST